jgi:hypothetical protein
MAYPFPYDELRNITPHSQYEQEVQAGGNKLFSYLILKWSKLENKLFPLKNKWVKQQQGLDR